MSGENINSADILITGDYTNHETVEEVLDQLLGSINEPNGPFALDDSGSIDSDLLPETTINGHVASNDSINKSIVDVHVNRVDKFIEQKTVTEILYSNDDYLLDSDPSRPNGKLSYIEYGTGVNDPLVSLIYSPQGKLIRVDYYLDRNSFTLDGSGRSGFNSITYNNLGKLESSVFTGLQEI